MKLHLDCSYTRQQRGNIGITRVVRGLARGQPPALLRLAAVHSSGFRSVASADEPAPPAAAANAHELWRRLYRLSGSSSVRRVLKALIPVAIQVRAWRFFSRRAFDGFAAALPQAEILAGDILIAADASWTYDIWPCAEQAKRSGARIATIVYDLIPVSAPQFCAPALRRLFEEWLMEALRCSDAILCISEATRAELQHYCGERRLRCPPTASFRLGGELPPRAATGPAPREFIRELSHNSPFFLTVGTIEPRKNHSLMLDVFDGCWQRGVEATLIVVGRPSDGTQATQARIQAHPRLGRNLFLVTDASDAELDLLYRGARAVILATLAEGFGLPLVEARQRGCEVFASRLPAFEELADDGVRLFAPGAASALAELIESALATPRPARLPPMPEFTWRESAQQFTSALERLLPASVASTRSTFAAQSP